MVDKTRMTAAEFFELPESNLPTELIDGEIIMSPAPVPKHQRLNGRFYLTLADLIPNGEVLYAPIDVHLDEDNVVEPDLVWVAENSRCIITEKRLEGPPDLIIEIFSPSTARRDKKEKYELYERYGVREYWMADADPLGNYLEVYVWADGKYMRQGVYGAADSFESTVLGGKTVDLKPIFAD
jgi:Uma2 family endonuclease